MFLRNWLRTRLTNNSSQLIRRNQPRLGVLQLEDRTVPSADLVSAFGIGNDTGGSRAFDVATDAAGNSYLTGYFSGTNDFDPANTHAGDTDILNARGFTDAFVAKYAPDNTLIWALRMGGDTPSTGALTDTGRKIQVDSGSNVYVVGDFQGSADIGSINLTSAGGSDGFVAKLSAGGTVVWAKRWGTAGDNDSGVAIDVDSAGNSYVIGSRIHSLALPNDGNGNDLLKFSPTGGNVWTEWINTRALPSSADLEVNASGEVFITGQFWGTVDFNPGSTTKTVSSNYGYSGYVLKLKTNGGFDWVSPFVGQSNGSTLLGFASGQSLALDNSGNVIVGGFYGGSVDFDPGKGVTLLSTTGHGFITKLNSSGGFVWAKALEGGSSTMVYGLAVELAGSIYATGSFSGTVDFDPGAGVSTRMTAGGSDAFALKLDLAGDFSWVDTFGGTGQDYSFGIAVDSAGDIHLAGSFQNTVDFDFDPDPTNTYNLTAPGTYGNIFLVKLHQH